MQDAIAEILTLKIGDHKSAYIGLDIPESSIRLMFEPLKKGGDDLLLKICSRKSSGDRFALSGRKVLIPFAHYIQPYTGVHQGYFRFFVFRNTDSGMQGDGIPHQLQGGRGQTMRLQEIPRGIGPVYLKAFVRTTVMRRKPQVMKYGAHIQQLGIIGPLLPLAIQSSEKKNPQGMVIQKSVAVIQ